MEDTIEMIGDMHIFNGCIMGILFKLFCNKPISNHDRFPHI